MGGCITREPDVDFESPVDFDHFHILRAIGKGAFGKVCIVKKKDTKDMYAMKYMNKVQIIRKHAVENVFREIEILRKLEHNFLVNLWFTFQDQEDMFMVLDLMLGGDISYHLEKQGRFNVPRVRLYLAELSLALEYLKEHRVIHRDVKPANMLLDSGGHVHLTDFNVACIVHSGVPITSITGTKPYMAPEVLRSRGSDGYSYAVDWWGLGVSAYEMLRGQRPFSIDRHMTNEEIVSNIRRTRPSASVRWDHQTCDLLRMLLHPDESKRLQTVESMRQHRFFQDTDWDQVEKKETTPVYVPAQNRIHCDPTHELEEMIVEPNPLHKKHHRLSRRNFRVEDETLVEELERMERRFSVYNRIKLKEAERTPKESSDGIIDTTIQLENNLDQKPEIDTHEPSSINPIQTSDGPTHHDVLPLNKDSSSTAIDQLSQGVGSTEGTEKENGRTEPDAIVSNSDNIVVEKNIQELREVQERKERGEEGKGDTGGHNDSAVVVSEEITAEESVPEEDRLSVTASPNDTDNTTKSDHIKSHFVRVQSSEDDPTPSSSSHGNVVESLSLSPPYSNRASPSHVERTDSMSSAALLLPQEV